MVSHLFFYQLTLIALVWLCVMLQWVWPSDSVAACPTTLAPPPPRPKRRRASKPFAGLTTKPHCDACARATAPRPQAPSPPPPRIVMTRGRRREIDTSSHFCPNPDCAYRGWPSAWMRCWRATPCPSPRRRRRPSARNSTMRRRCIDPSPRRAGVRSTTPRCRRTPRTAAPGGRTRPPRGGVKDGSVEWGAADGPRAPQPLLGHTEQGDRDGGRGRLCEPVVERDDPACA
jgi:hypothetical protein